MIASESIVEIKDLKKSYLALNFEGGYRGAPENWAALQEQMIDAMSKIEATMSPLITELRKVGNKFESGVVEGN